MNTENPAHIASISEASPSTHETLLHDFSFENDKCTCVADAGETCIRCAVKEYQEALQKVRDYSIKCAMPKSKNTRKSRKRFYQNYARNSEQSDICNKNVEPSKNCSAELQHDQTSDTENSLFNTETNSIPSPTQNSHTSFQPSTNFQHAENCTTDTSVTQSLQTQNCRTSDTEDCHEHSQLGTELLIKSEPCDRNSDSDALMSESSQEITSRSESFERSDEACDYESDHSSSSVNLQEYQDFKPKILLDIKIEPCDNDDSDSVETQNTISDCQQDQNHSPDSPVDKDLNIRTKLCDMNSNSKETEDFHLYYQLGNELHIKNEPCDTDSNSKEAQDCREHSKLGNELQIKSEPCDINSDSDRLMSESSPEIKSRSERFKCSDEVCDSEIDHSNSSSMVEVKSAKSSGENHDDSPPNQDLKRSRRNSKRKREVEDRCPVCGLTVRYTELESHFAKEVENLSNIPRNVRKNRASERNKEREGFRCGVNIGFVQAKCNRENRLAEKRAKYVKKHIVFCPVCKIRLSGTDEEINDHVLSCFGEDDDSDINVTDFDENFEEYEIGDETRIRAISLVPGGHSALHGYSSKSKSANDEDDGVDVNVDVDDTLAFGKPQYTELDVIHNISGASNEKEEQLRRAVVSDPSAEPHVIEGKKWSRDCDIQNDIDEIISSCKESKPTEMKPKEDDEDMKMEGNFKEEKNSQNSESGIISSLKERIKDLEQQKNVKCLICLEPYTRPVVSTTCWHVHCEECWLVSMGVKKLCPQCNMIVFPTDLRRIYL